MMRIPAQPAIYFRHYNLSGKFAGVSARRRVIISVVFLLAHIPLGILCRNSGFASTAHAFITLLVGLCWVLSNRGLLRAAYVAAYITGAEVLWRMTEAQVFWEIGKYSVVAVFLVALVRSGRFRRLALPASYFVLLLPSVALTFMTFDLMLAREKISFNLSGPLSLMVCVWFFANLRLAREQLLRLFLALLGPVIAVTAIASSTMFGNPEVSFGSHSNYATSGGYGPNQVSAMLGLGALLAFFYLMEKKAARSLKIIMFCLVVVFSMQSALTFSRSGLYSAAGGTLLMLLFMLKNGHSRVKVIIVFGILLIAANYVVLPLLDNFTGGALSNRFSDTSSTGRDLIVKADLEIWADNPLLGVGPGGSKDLHELTFRSAAAHTEFSRLLSEHGSFGFISLILLLIMAVQSFRRAATAKAKGITATLIFWSFLFMLTAAMRLVAPSFIFGLSFATLASRDRSKFEYIQRAKHLVKRSVGPGKVRECRSHPAASHRHLNDAEC